MHNTVTYNTQVIQYSSESKGPLKDCTLESDFSICLLLITRVLFSSRDRPSTINSFTEPKYWWVIHWLNLFSELSAVTKKFKRNRTNESRHFIYNFFFCLLNASECRVKSATALMMLNINGLKLGMGQNIWLFYYSFQRVKILYRYSRVDSI